MTDKIEAIDVTQTSAVASIRVRSLIKEAMQKCLKPPPKLNLVEWADKYRFLPDNSAESGLWKTSRVEVARKPMLSVTDPDVQEVTIMCCIQLMKHLAVDTPMLTANGWSTMGELKQDDRVYGSDGNLCNVIAKSDTSEVEPCYEIEFSGGEKVVCSESHNWNVDDSESRTNTVKYGVTKSTKELFKTFSYINYAGKKINRYAIPVTKPLVNELVDYSIDPYVLGCWLGDGHSYSTRITMHKDDTETLMEFGKRGYSFEEKKTSESSSIDTREFKINKIAPKNECPYGHHIDSEVRCRICSSLFSNPRKENPRYKDRINKKLFQLLSELNLVKNKHIPSEYLRGSFEQRLNLLQGLMDTDGTISKKGNVSFSTSSKKLRDGFVELALSLGFKPSPRLVKTTHKDSYNIAFTAYSETPVFKLNRKLSRMNSETSKGARSSESKRRRIVNIIKVDTVPVQCIAVDSPDHLYLCGRHLIPTHNTELMLNTALFYMAQEPSPMMYVAPKADLAEAWSKERFVKSVNATPVLKDVFSGNRRGEGNTITQKQFTGGQISIVSARNPADLAMRAVRILMFDECDKYPLNTGSSGGGEGGEGDPIAVAWGRATTYGKRAKKLVACSPTVKHKSRIEKEYENSNRSIYQQKCPHCEELQSLTWINVYIPKLDTEAFDHQNAKIVCPSCGVLWTESDRHYSIRNGDWLARKPEVTWHHGYQVSALASPFTPIPTLAKEFSDAQGNPEALKAFKNTRLAETWAEAGEKPEWRSLYDRRESYSIGKIPKNMVILTCGIDVQKDHIYYEVVAWGKKNENYSIDHGVINGVFEDAAFKETLSIFCSSTYKDHNDVDVIMSKIAIDSGYNTNEVYAFCRSYGSSRVVPIKGDPRLQTSVGTPRPVDVLVDGKRYSRGLQLWSVGSGVIKEQIYRWFNAKCPTDESFEKGATYPTGYSHFPMYGEEYFKQVTAEQLVTRTNKRGYSVSEWETTRKDNHLLDCRVYARAGAVMLQIDRMTEEDFDAILSQREPVTLEQRIETAAPKRKRKGWIKK